MALSSSYRWAALCEVSIHPSGRIKLNPPEFQIETLNIALSGRIAAGNQFRFYGRDDSQLMWHSDVSASPNHFSFLVHAGNKNTTGTSFVDFDNFAIRDVEKFESEGAQNSAHVVIRRAPRANGMYKLLFEKVPGISMSSLRDHFRWAANLDAYGEEYVNANGHEALTTAHFDVVGLGSRTLGQAIADGTFQDVEFVKTYEEPAALDEEIEVQRVRSDRFDVRRKTTLGIAGQIIESLGKSFQDFAEGGESEMYVRIKAASGQIKRTEITDFENPLEQAFVENAFLSDFDEPLPSRYDAPNDEILNKLIDRLNRDAA